MALASFQEQFDMAGLLRFPVNFRSFYLLYMVFGLMDVSTMLGGLCCLGILIGITTVRPEMFVWTALGLAGFALFNILLARAILAWMDRWLAQTADARDCERAVSAVPVKPATAESSAWAGQISES